MPGAALFIFVVQWLKSFHLSLLLLVLAHLALSPLVVALFYAALQDHLPLLQLHSFFRRASPSQAWRRRANEAGSLRMGSSRAALQDTDLRLLSRTRGPKPRRTRDLARGP